MRVGSRQIQIAKGVNFLNFLQDEYPNLIEYSHHWKAYIHPEHDSMKYYEHGFFRFSTNTGGDAIQFLQDYCNMTFQDAVMILYKYAGGHEDVSTYTRTNDEYKPPAATQKSYNRTFAYLTLQRKISKDIITELINKKLLYEDIRSNIVFINPEPGNRIAIARGTLTYGDLKPYRRIYTEQNNNYWELKFNDTPKKVYVCEAPIDAISLYELAIDKNAVYTAMAGLKPATLQRIIRDYPNAEIIIATDWDDAGRNFSIRQHNELKLKVIAPAKEYRKKCKDWNDYLKVRKAEINE